MPWVLGFCKFVYLWFTGFWCGAGFRCRICFDFGYGVLLGLGLGVLQYSLAGFGVCCLAWFVGLWLLLRFWCGVMIALVGGWWVGLLIYCSLDLVGCR